MFSFFSNWFGSGSSSIADPNDPRWLKARSRNVNKLLLEWGVFDPTARNPEAYQEYFTLPRDVVSRILKHARSLRNWDQTAWSAHAAAYVKEVVDYLLGQHKTDDLLKRVLLHNAEFELLVVCAPAQCGFRGKFGLGECTKLEEELVKTFAQRLVERGVEVAAGLGMRKTTTLEDRISRRLYFQAITVEGGDKLRMDRIVFIAKCRFDYANLTRNILIRDSQPGDRAKSEGIMFCESKTFALRKDSLDSAYFPVTRRGFAETYCFYFSSFSSKQLSLRVVDFYPSPQKPMRGRRLWAFEDAISQARSVTPTRIAQEICNSYAQGRIQAAYYPQDGEAEALLGWESGQNRDRKGVLELIAWAPRQQGKDDNVSIRMLADPHVDHLRITGVQVMQAAAQGISEPAVNTGDAVHVLQCMEAASVASDGFANLWASLKRSGSSSTSLLLLHFAPHLTSKGKADGTYCYHLTRGAALDPSLEIRVAPLEQVVDDTGRLTPERLKTLPLMEPALDVQVFDPNKGLQQNGAQLADLVQFITVGCWSKGWVFFRINPGSQAKPLSEEQETFVNEGTATTITRISKFCSEHLQITNLTSASEAYTQGELLVGEKDLGDGSPLRKHYVKAFLTPQLEANDGALPKSWEILSAQQPPLVPDGTERRLLDFKGYEFVRRGRQQATIWLFVTPEHSTLEGLLKKKRTEGSLDPETCLRLACALRAFYAQAIEAGLAFPDCSIDDLLVSEDGERIWLVDFGSYRPMQAYVPSPSPGKDNYRDPGLIAYLARDGDPLNVQAQAHSYNLGLLEYYLWSGGVPPTWPSLYERLAEDTTGALYQDALESALARLGQSLHARSFARRDRQDVETHLRALLAFDPLARPVPGQLPMDTIS